MNPNEKSAKLYRAMADMIETDFKYYLEGQTQSFIPKNESVIPDNVGSYKVTIEYAESENEEESMNMQRKKLLKLARNVDLGIWFGMYKGGFTKNGVGIGEKLTNGIMDRAKIIKNVMGDNSVLSSSKDAFETLRKMIDLLPTKYMNGYKIHIIISFNLFMKLTSRDSPNREDYWGIFHESYLKEKRPIHVRSLMAEDRFDNLGDKRGVHDRIVVIVADPSVVEKYIAIERSPPSVNERGNITEEWRVKFAGIVHDPDAVLLSERITWKK